MVERELTVVELPRAQCLNWDGGREADKASPIQHAC